MKAEMTPGEIAERIKRAASIALITHRRPDGDAVGSVCGLKYAIEATMPGKQVVLFCADEIPERLRFLAPGEKFLTEKPFGFRADLVMTVDIASRKLFGELETVFADEVDIKLDHHESGENFAPRHFVDPHAAAAGELVFELIPHLGAVQNGERLRAAYYALYGAIVSDTGGFRYSNVTARTHRIAAALIEAGVNGAEIAHGLFESHAQGEIRAIRAAYDKMRFYEDGKIAIATITLADMKQWEIDEDVLGVVSSLPREIKGVEVGVILRQSAKYPDTFKISMRSGETVAANAVCAAFGGGGHLRAAGGEVHAASAEEAESAVLHAILRQVRA